MASKASAVVGAAAAGVAAVTSYAYVSLSRPTQSAEAPSKEETKMKKLYLVKPAKDPSKAEIIVKQVDIPRPKQGQVLIKMVAAVVNPSDYRVWTTFGSDGTEQVGDQAIGKEGAGVVVASGGGMMANRLVGKAVGVAGWDSGTYGEYIIGDAMRVVTLDDNVKVEDAASFFVNPMTVLGILDMAASRGAKVFIHTAAASQLGQMMIKFAPSTDMTIVNLVRRKEQVDLLKSLGAEFIVCTADKDWKQQLSALIKELDIKVAFDAVAGDMSGDLLSLLPHHGTCFVYGSLSRNRATANAIDLIYNHKHLEGFFLKNWLDAGGTLAMIRRVRTAMKLVNDGLKEGGWAETSFVDCRLDDMHDKFAEMWNKDGFTGKKLRIRMD